VQKIATQIWGAGDVISTRLLSISTAFVSNKEELAIENIKLKEEIEAIRLKLIDRDLVLSNRLQDVFGQWRAGLIHNIGPGLHDLPFDRNTGRRHVGYRVGKIAFFISLASARYQIPRHRGILQIDGNFR